MEAQTTVTIRRAEPADAADLADLAARTFWDTFAADNRPEDMAAHMRQTFGPAQQGAEITDPRICTLLAISEGVIGFTQIRTGPPPACVTEERPLEIWRFYVDHRWHGRGVAQRLMQAALREAAAQHATAVWLGVWERNARATAFYRKCGFVDVGAHDFILGQDVQTDRIMVRRLTAAAPT